jgi:hypothetical protein
MRVDIDSDLFSKVQALGYSVVFGYRGNALYNMDRNDNGIIDKTEFTDTTHAHCLRSCYFIGHIPKYASKMTQIIDNYPDRNTNLYFTPLSNLKTLVSNRVFFKSGYIYLLQ